MTQQYLVGELSQLLGLLQATISAPSPEHGIAKLRREAEQTTPAELDRVVTRSLASAEALCWETLTRGDARTFAEQAEIAAELHQFGACSGLLDDP